MSSIARFLNFPRETRGVEATRSLPPPQMPQRAHYPLFTLIFIGDAIALWAYRREANTAVLRRLVPSVLAGVGLGALLLAVSTQAQVRRAISAILLLLVIVTLAQRRWGPPRLSHGRVARAAYRTLTGFTTMAAKAGGPVTSIYFLASRFSVSEFLGTTAWFFFTVNVIKAPFTIGMGLLRLEHLPLIGLLAPWCSRAHGRGDDWPPASRCASSNPSSSRRQSWRRYRCSYKKIVSHAATARSRAVLARHVLLPKERDSFPCGEAS